MPSERWLANGHRGDAAALFAGCLTPLAFAPFGLFPLAVLAPALLFVVWRRSSAGRAAWRGFLYGFGLFGVGVSWIYVSLHDFGHMPPPLAALAVVLFVAGLSLYPALLGLLQAKFARAPAVVHLLLALPAAWVLFEWLRGWILTGFPWLNLGYSQSDSALAGYAPVLGVYGVGLIVAVCAGVLAVLWLERKYVWQSVALLLALWLGGWALGQIGWAQPIGKPLQVALVQGNIGLAQKWSPEHRQAIVDRYVHLSERAGNVDLIVWPEAALPGHVAQFGPTLWPRLEQLRRTQGAELVLGAVEYDSAQGRYYNSVVRVGPTPVSYRKRHLVPFGEFLPWPVLFGALIEQLHIPMSNFSRGAATQPSFTAAGQALGVSVCYEDAFGEEMIAWLPQASVLVNVSEDAWFGNSLAPHQRLQMAQLRALEAGRPMVRAANTGPSVVIDHRGEILSRSPQFEPHVLVAAVQPMQGTTIYVRLGNTATVVLALTLLVAAGWRATRVRPPAHTRPASVKQ